jgi:hypothetical protein
MLSEVLYKFVQSCSVPIPIGAELTSFLHEAADTITGSRQAQPNRIRLAGVYKGKPISLACSARVVCLKQLIWGHSHSVQNKLVSADVRSSHGWLSRVTALGI